MLGSLVRTVRDQSGAVIRDAGVVATEQQTGLVYKQIANSAGDYVFNNLPIGTYTVTYTAPFFRELRVQGIETHVASMLRQDATLEVASISTNLEVESSTPLVKTETAEIGQLVDSRQISELPLNGRNVFSLLTLSGARKRG